MSKLQKLLLALGCLLLLAAATTYAGVRYANSPDRGTPLVYANNAMLLELWDTYKTNNIEPSSHRTLDKSQNNITTSEGESYTMLRSVWMDDKTTFDQSWQFTKNNLQRPNDHLLSWKFGQKSDGSYGVLTDIGGQNTASDADSDVALSLLMAYSRWNQTSYRYEAEQIIQNIWEKEVVPVQGKPVLAADNLEASSVQNIVVNPSYFSPYSFKLFAKVDTTPGHDWQALADNSYSLLTSLSANMLGSTKSSGLPPNWITMNRVTGEVIPNASPNLDTNYGYDAFRIPWRLALDYQWNKDPRDKALLENFKFLGDMWEKTGALQAVYSHDGTVASNGNYETPAMYGTAMGYFTVVDKDEANAVYNLKLQPLYSPDKQSWKSPLAYYDDNWAWFGIALYQDQLPNLAVISN